MNVKGPGIKRRIARWLNQRYHKNHVWCKDLYHGGYFCIYEDCGVTMTAIGAVYYGDLNDFRGR